MRDHKRTIRWSPLRSITSGKTVFHASNQCVFLPSKTRLPFITRESNRTRVESSCLQSCCVPGDQRLIRHAEISLQVDPDTMKKKEGTRRKNRLQDIELLKGESIKHQTHQDRAVCSVWSISVLLKLFFNYAYTLWHSTRSRARVGYTLVVESINKHTGSIRLLPYRDFMTQDRFSSPSALPYRILITVLKV